MHDAPFDKKLNLYFLIIYSLPYLLKNITKIFSVPTMSKIPSVKAVRRIFKLLALPSIGIVTFSSSDVLANRVLEPEHYISISKSKGNSL